MDTTQPSKRKLPTQKKGLVMGFVSRREFVRLGTGAAAVGAAAKSFVLEPEVFAAPSDRKIRFVSIGTGIRGCDLLRSARKLPNAQLVGIADLYDMHRKAGVESYGSEVPTTRDYRELLDRKDVDAVIVAVADFQHRRVVLDCIDAGKDVYCEKPMSHNVADGFAMVKAVQEKKRIFQAGSQRVSSVVFKKAAEIYKSGRLGEVTLVTASMDRNADSGAWVYPIAPGASPETIDWKMWLRDAPDRPFDPVRFFRWRCFADYGEGLAGDLFVHLLSGFQCVSGINTPPSRSLSAGSLTHFKDGRDYPDLLVTLFDYPGITVNMRCNQNNDTGEDTTFYGKEGTLTIKGDSVTFTPQDTRPQPEYYSVIGWTEEARKKYYDDWNAAHPGPQPNLPMSETFSAPRDYDDTAEHIATFLRAVETREHVVEDEVFGNNAAIACHMANHSYVHKNAATWDPNTQTIKS